MPTPDIRILLDTNVLIQTEDNTQIKAPFAELTKKCLANGLRIYLHQANIDDVNRDSDEKRKAITLSKAAKYPLLSGIPLPDKTALEIKFGEIKRANDQSDVELLHAVSIGAVTFLVTEDTKLHKRAEKAGLSDRVLTVADAVDWIKQAYDPASISLPDVKSLKCHQIDLTQDIFDSLKKAYPFEDWFNNTCIPNHRDCWTITHGDRIIGIAIWKEEVGEEFTKEFTTDAPAVLPKAKVLKVCTYKVHDDFRGSKIGEHLLKQILWYAFKNKFDWVYLTAYEEEQAYLVSFLETFGFEAMGEKGTELIIGRPFEYSKGSLSGLTPLEFHKKFYPNFYDGKETKKFVVPLHPAFHYKLFPEYTHRSKLQLFDSDQLGPINISGNAIRKVYVCRAQAKSLSPGDLIFFYMNKSDDFTYSQSITVVGVVDGVQECKNLSELVAATAKRSVYSQNELAAMFNGDDRPVKLIDFFIAGHIKGSSGQPPTLKELESFGVLKGAPQSILQLPADRYEPLRKGINIILTEE